MNSLPTVQKGCFCCSLKVGAVSVSVLYMTYGLLMIIGSFIHFLFYRHRRRNSNILEKIESNKYIQYIDSNEVYTITENFFYCSHAMIAVVLFIISVLLLIGITTNKTRFTVAWIYTGAVCLFIQLLCLLVVIGLSLAYQEKIFWVMLVIFFGLLFTALLFYCILVVNTYSKSLSRAELNN